MRTLQRFTVTEDMNKHLQQLNWDDKLAVAVSIKRAEYVKLNASMSFHCFNHPNKIYEYSTKFLLQRNFTFANELNRFIEQASDGGLINKWQRSYRFLDKEEIQRNFDSVKAESLILELIVHCTLSALACMILLLEKLVHKKVRMQASSPLWQFIQMAIDPERYFLLNDFTY